MLERIKKVDNPLTVIAIFAGVAEVADAVALPHLNCQVQAIFVWFLMGFPTLLVIAFFCTLNWNHRVLYAPSDYRDDSGFFRALGSGETNSSEVRITAPSALTPAHQSLRANPDEPITQFAGVPSKISAAVNHAFVKFGEKSRKLFTDGAISACAISPQGPNLFLLQVDLKTRAGNAPMLQREVRIIDAKENNGGVELSVEGKNYRSTTPDDFAEFLFRDVSESINRRT